jgi:hypothetical protein
MAVRFSLLLCLCACAAFPEIPKDSAQSIDANQNGILKIKVYPPEASIILNDHNLGKGKVSVENLRPGYYKITCKNKSKVTEELVKIYPGLVSDANLSAVVPYFNISSGITTIISDQFVSAGPNIEIGFGFDHHYVGLNYCWSTYSGSKTTSHYSRYNYIKHLNNSYPFVNDTIPGTLESNNKKYKTFSGGGFVYLYKGAFALKWIGIDPGIQVGFISTSMNYEYSQRFQDSTGNWSTINDYTLNELKNYIAGPVFRVCIGPRMINLTLNYSYLFGEKNGQLISANLQVHL